MDDQYHARSPAEEQDVVQREVFDFGEVAGQALQASQLVMEIATSQPGPFSARMLTPIDGFSAISTRAVPGGAAVKLQIDIAHSLRAPFELELATNAIPVLVRGVLVVAQPEGIEVKINGAVGQYTSQSIRIRQRPWVETAYTVTFEPKLREVWVTEPTGIIGASSYEWPFKILFAPKHPGFYETRMLVSVPDREFVYDIRASAKATKKRRRDDDDW